MGRNSFYILSFGFTFSTLDFKFSSTTVEDSLQISPFMQNEPNFRKSQMNVNPYSTTHYENKHNWTLGENEPKRTQNEPNFKKAKMNVSYYITKGYENKSNWAICENKPNSKPKQTQFQDPTCPHRSGRGHRHSRTFYPKILVHPSYILQISLNIDTIVDRSIVRVALGRAGKGLTCPAVAPGLLI